MCMWKSELPLPLSSPARPYPSCCCAGVPQGTSFIFSRDKPFCKTMHFEVRTGTCLMAADAWHVVHSQQQVPC
jgi:hypothetical protein